MNSTLKRTLIASSIAMAVGAPVANAALVENIYGAYTWSTDRANFSMLNDGGGSVGGTNDVAMTWDGNAYTASSDYTGPGGGADNVTAVSTTPFFNHTWSAHDIQVFVPGSYSFDTSLGGGNPEAGMLNVTVPAGHIGMHMLFDWNSNNNIDVFVVAAPSSMYGTGQVYSGNSTAFGGNNCSTGVVQNCLWDGPGWVGGNPANRPFANTVWMLATVDGNGDGVMGIPMATGGPFADFNAGFNATMSPTPKPISEVPVPAAVWLLGSGLMGLVGVARRRKSA